MFSVHECFSLRLPAFLLCLFLLAFPVSAPAEGMDGMDTAAMQSINPFQEVEENMSLGTSSAPLLLPQVDFGEGASFLRIKAKAESRTILKICSDSVKDGLLGTMVFLPVTKEARMQISLSGVHDLYILAEGACTLISWQAFTDLSSVEAAIAAERDTGRETGIPSAYTVSCPRGGTTGTFTYMARDRFQEDVTYEKTAGIYLPAGYDENSVYDLLILCHGIGGSEKEWGLAGGDSRAKNILDNLIDRGEIRPLVVVTPDGRAGHTEDNSSAFYAFDLELREDLLPFLQAHYAVDTTDRSRCAMAGLSMGAMQTINLGIGKCLDLFSAFGAFSACPTTSPAAVTAAVLNSHAEYPVRVFYSICGLQDQIALYSADNATMGLMEKTGSFTEDNCIIQHVPGGHDFGVWHLGLYNFLRLIQGI